MTDLKPISVDRETWLYAEGKGLCVVRQIRNPKGELIQSDIFYLPWSKIELAVSKKPARKRAP